MFKELTWLCHITVSYQRCSVLRESCVSAAEINDDDFLYRKMAIQLFPTTRPLEKYVFATLILVLLLCVYFCFA